MLIQDAILIAWISAVSLVLAYFCQAIAYTPAGAMSPSFSSSWYASGGTVTINDALLPSDNYGWQVLVDPSSYGRVRAMLRADHATYAYARAVTAVGDTSTTTTWQQGVVRQITRTASEQFASSQYQQMDGSWETPITYSTAAAGQPPSSYVEPAVGSIVPSRTTSVNRDPVTFMVTQRSFPDGGNEYFTYNGFNLVLSHTDQLNHVENFGYDTFGNMTSHVAAAGVTGVAATESWTYSGSATATPGVVLSHTDFNGNQTSFAYYSTSGTWGHAGELEYIVLPVGTLQPSGTITLTYDNFGRVQTVIDPSSFARTVTFSYDALGRHTQTLYPDGSTEVTAYDATVPPQVDFTYDRNGNETQFSYYALTDSASHSAGLLKSVLVHQGTTATVLSSSTKTYDGTTDMLTSVNTDGRETDFAYDYLNRIAATTVHPSGTLALTSSNVYDRYRLEETLDYYNRASKFYYDVMDRSTSTSVELTPGGTTIGTSAAYNKAGLLTDAYDGNHNHSQYVYDARNRRTVTTYAVGTALAASTTAAYDANSNVTTFTDERGHNWTKTYSARDQILTASDPLSNSSSYSYTSDALVQSMTNANGNATSYTYKYCCPRLQYQTDALSYSKSYSYDPVGNVTGGTDESLRDVAYTFDGLNRQLTMTLDPGGTGSLNLTSSTAYYTPGSGSIGLCTMTTTNAAGQQIVTIYDGMGRVLSTSGNTAPVSYTYDTVVGSGSLAGLVVSTVTTGSGSTVLTTSAYADGAGRTVKTVDALGKSSSMSYDGNNNLVLTIDPDARTVSSSFDARNRMTQSVLGTTATTSYQYDATNNLTQVTDADSKITQYGYDNANRRTSTTYAYSTSNATTWSMSYTPLGQLQVLTKPTSATITYSYEPRELLSSRVYGGTAPSATDSFTYYPNRLLLSASGGIYNMNVSRGTAGVPTGIGSWYDGANRLIQEQQTFGGLTKTMSYQYTPDSLVSQIVYPDGTTTIGRNYNDHRLLYQTLVGSSTQATFGYDPADRRISMVYGNSGEVTSGTLDNNGRVTDLAVTSGTNTLQEWKYGYTDAGDPLSQNDVSYGTMGEAYQYDTIHRLGAYQRGQVTSGSNTIASPSSSQAWTLTGAGDWSQWINTVGATTTTDTRTHNNLHALTARSVLTPSLSYDADWNQTDDATNYTFVYDANDQLQQVKTRGGSPSLVGSYTYDAFGRRASKYVASSGSTTVYFYNDQQVVEEYAGSGGTAAYYTYGDGIDERVTMHRGASDYYYHANRLGSVYLLSNGTAGIVERYAYSPYGVVTVSDSAYGSSGTAPNVGNPYLFTGREFDPESGLYNYRARTYDPVQGRFKQLDPLGLSGGVNLYEYVRGNPLGNTDIFGLFADGADNADGADLSKSGSNQKCPLDDLDALNAGYKAKPFIVTENMAGEVRGEHTHELRRCYVHFTSAANCPKFPIGLTSAPTRRGTTSVYDIDICISNRLDAKSQLLAIKHELTHAKRFCDKGTGITTIAACKTEERAAYEKSCVQGRGHSRCVKCGVYLGCKYLNSGNKNNTHNAGDVVDENPPCTEGDLGLSFK